MAFTLQGLSRISTSANTDSVILWAYKSTTDALATISASAYFASLSIKAAIGDKIFVEGTDGETVLRITALIPVTTASASGSPPVSQDVNITWSGPWAAPQAGTAKIVVDGNAAILTIAAVSAAGNTATQAIGTLTGFGALTPTTQLIGVTDNTVEVIGSFSISVESMVIGVGVNAASFQNIGTAGFTTFSVAYIIS